jgi:hypothetical protein
LDPNDPSDAGKDEDKDGLSNLFEYTKNLNPNKADTDGDGFSDKVELDKGTDPLDPKSKPKSALGTILLILLLIVILAGAGYGAYYYYEKNMKKPKPHPSLRTPTTKQQIPIAKPTAKKTASTETFRKREEEKKQKRGKQFEVFGKKEAKEKKPLVSKSKVVKEASKPKKPKVSKAKLISKKDEKASKAKGEDTIRKLREIASKKKSRKAKKRKT